MASTIRVGDRDVTIDDFSGYKFMEATELLSGLLEVVPELDQEIVAFGKTWAEANPPRVVDRATAALELGPAAARIDDETWEAVDGKLTIPGSAPDGMQLIIRLFPRIQRHARTDFQNLLALCCTPNSELEEADEQGVDLYDGDGPVAKQRRYLLHRGKPTQLVKVLLAAMDALAEEIREGDLASAVGNLREKWTAMTGATSPEPDSAPTATSSETDDASSKASKRSDGGARGSSTSSSRRTRASRAATSSTGSRTGS